MNLKHNITFIFLGFSSVFFSQEIVQKDTIIKPEIKISYLDSIKKTFVSHKNAEQIDSLWLKDMNSLNVYDELLADIKTIDIDQKVDFELPTELLKERLKKLDEKSPFNIEYNIGLENVIKSFLKNRKRSFERLMGISQFYFPLFEDELSRNNIPLEIKYLAVIESALNPRAVSHCGATGLWQFMYQTGKQYGLNINSYVDDRIEPVAASKAASQYMKNMFKIFNDWDLVLAAYNSGPGNVAKAIRRSNGQQNYWNIRTKLPKETQGYLPAFLATMYIFEYHKEHGIVPNKAVANHYALDTIMIKKPMTFKQVSSLLDISVEELQFFNPSYKRNEIPFVTNEKHFLTLPKDKIGVFTSNEDKIYAFLDYESSKRERPIEKLIIPKIKDSTAIASNLNLDAISEYKNVTKTKYYSVRKGDNLTEISNKFGVTIWDLKKWNAIRGNKAKVGRNLKIIVTDRIAFKPKVEKTEAIVSKPIETVVAVTEDLKLDKTEKTERIFKTEKITLNKEIVKYHKVKKGENLSEIAADFNVSLSEIKKWNGLKNSTVNKGKNLKIITTEKVVVSVKKEVKQPTLDKKEVIASTEVTSKGDVSKKEVSTKELKNQKYYIVERGDNLYAIAHKNNVTVKQLIEWNDLKDENVNLGSQLIIPNDFKNETALNAKMHTVVKGDNVRNIAAKYKISIAHLKEWNELETNDIAIGASLIVSKSVEKIAETSKKSKKEETVKKAKDYLVKSGDSLFSISQKFPGVTIADLKKWNNIKGESLKPGMKLKING